MSNCPQAFNLTASVTLEQVYHFNITNFIKVGINSPTKRRVKMGKRIVSFVLLLCMIFALVPVQALAQDTTTDEVVSDTNEPPVEPGTQAHTSIDWEYEAYRDGIALTKYLGTGVDIYVPNHLEIDGTDYQVLKLADGIFENNDAINSVTLASGILEIGEKAFYDCDNFVCILVSEELTTIGSEAFYSCDVFNSVILYNSLTSIGTNAFAECPNLTI